MTLKAILFDVDGTLAETEEGHRAAWNATFADRDLNWHWDFETYKSLLKITGGRERLRSFAKGRLSDAEIAAIHQEKNDRYRQSMAAGEISLLPGVRGLIDEAREAGIAIGIATTTSRGNVDALIEGTLGREAFEWFSAVACAEDAPNKKPDPQVYRIALDQLGVAAHHTVAIEDSRNGLLAAHRAQIPVVLVQSRYMAGEDTRGADMIVASLADTNLAGIAARLYAG